MDDVPADAMTRYVRDSYIRQLTKSGLKPINTAVSRAKRRLVIVCDVEHWGGREGELIGVLVRKFALKQF